MYPRFNARKTMDPLAFPTPWSARHSAYPLLLLEHYSPEQFAIQEEEMLGMEGGHGSF